MAEPVQSASGRPPGGDVVVAIDGPGGAGKSTVARALARRRGLRYLDTGAIYRALTWRALRAGTDLTDASALAEIAGRTEIVVSTDPDAPGVRVDGSDVTAAIRRPDVTAAVSAVSAVPAVRALLVGLQRRLIGAGGIVVEGRDIATVVVPDADAKVYLTASGDARADRRARELAGVHAGVPATVVRGRGDHGPAGGVRADLDRRDRLDSTRPASPLSKAPDAVEIDSTLLGVEQVVDAIESLLPVRDRPEAP